MSDDWSTVPSVLRPFRMPGETLEQFEKRAANVLNAAFERDATPQPFAGIEFPDEERTETRYYRADGTCLIVGHPTDCVPALDLCRQRGEMPAFKVEWRVTARALCREEI